MSHFSGIQRSGKEVPPPLGNSVCACFMQTRWKCPALPRLSSALSLWLLFSRSMLERRVTSMLSKAELLTFMDTELFAFTKNQKDPTILDHMMKKLGLNSDGQLDFQKFLNLTGSMVKACYDSFTKSTHLWKWIWVAPGPGLQTTPFPSHSSCSPPILCIPGAQSINSPMQASPASR